MHPVRITLEIVLRLVAASPDDAAHRADLAIADADIAAARAPRSPSVSAELRAGVAPGTLVRLPGTDVFVNGSPALDDASIQGRYALTVTFDQLITDFGQSRARIDAAEHARSAVEHDGAVERDARDHAAAAAFYRWAAAVAVADARRADSDAARDAAWRAEHQIEAGGAIADSDVPLAERVRAELVAARAESDARAARVALEVFTGPLPDGAEPDLAAPSITPDTADHVRAALLEHLAAGQAEVRALERTRRPILAGTAAIGARAVGDDGGVDRVLPAWEVGVALRLPLVDRDRDAALARARARVRRVEAEIAAHDRRRVVERGGHDTAYDDALARIELTDQLVLRCEQTLMRAESLARLGGEATTELDRARAAARAAHLERTLAAIDAAAAGFDAGRPIP